MKYFISDLHFHHKNILICNHEEDKFSSPEEREELIISNWNRTVNDKDDIYILGDIGFLTFGDTISYLKKLRGKLHIIIGNHDKIEHLRAAQALMPAKIIEIEHLIEFKEDGRYFTLCHYPLLEWPHFFSKGVHLHGHVHDPSEKCPREIFNSRIKGTNPYFYNVAVNLIDYRPISIKEIHRMIDADAPQYKVENI